MKIIGLTGGIGSGKSTVSEILKEMGYNVMVVTSSDYNRNKKDKKIIENCLNFLQC